MRFDGVAFEGSVSIGRESRVDRWTGEITATPPPRRACVEVTSPTRGDAGLRSCVRVGAVGQLALDDFGDFVAEVQRIRLDSEPGGMVMRVDFVEVLTPQAVPALTAQPWDGEPEGGGGELVGLRWSIWRWAYASGPWCWCGGVELPPGHPWRERELTSDPPEPLSVHGGISSQDDGAPRDAPMSIGFDCRHGGDADALDASPAPGAVFRTYAFARREVGRLAAQCLLAEAAGFGVDAAATDALRAVAPADADPSAWVVARVGGRWVAHDLAADDASHPLADASEGELREAAASLGRGAPAP